MECGKSSSLRSKRRRSSSKGDGDVASKKLHTEGSLVENQNDSSLNIDESSCVDDTKRDSELVVGGSTSTPSSLSPPTRRRRGRSSALLDDSVVRLEKVEIPGQSAVGLEAVADDGSRVVGSNGSARENEPSAERNSRRNKCTSARVLLGLVTKRKAGVPGKDSKEEKPDEKTDDVKEEVTDGTEKPRKSKPRKKSLGVVDAESKAGGTVPKVKEEKDILVSALEGTQEVSLSIEKCSDVKPDWIKPFKQGWRREVVFRNTSKNTPSSKPSCDVYYFSSDDTKLRSLPQIIEYLKTAKSNLTRDCFTFMKNTIYKEPEEQVRSAAFSRGRAGARTSLQNSNESSMKSFDDVNDDVCSQASSVSAVQKRSPVKTSGKKMKLSAEVSIKTDLKLELASDLPAPQPAEDVSVRVAAEEPSTLEKTETETKETETETKQTETETKETETETKETETETKEDVAAEVGGGQADELDKRKAVKAAATLALRTYMNHALRNVNNPLLQSKTVKTSDKAKTFVAKTPPKNKSLQVKHKIQPTDRNLSPVISLPKVDVTKKKVDELPSDSTKVKKAIEPVRSSKPSPLTKLARIKSVPKRMVAPEIEKVHARKTALLRKLPPSKLSASRAVVSKELVAKKETELSQNKSSKSLQNCGAPVKPAKPKVVTTPTVGKIHPKSDIKSTEKPAPMGEKRPPVGPVLPKPVESALIPTSRMCGMDCPLRLGIVPSLMCTTCMCVYHPECTGYVSQTPSSMPAMDFTCWFCRKLNKELEDTSYALGKCEIPLSSETCSNASKPRRSFESSEASCSKLPSDVLASSTSHKSSGVASDDISHGTVTAPSKSQDLVQDEPVNTSDILPSLPTAQLLVLPIGIKKFLNLSMALILVVEDQELQVEPDQLKTSSVGINIRLPMGTLPDVFVRGPESPLEFRVLSAATSGRQVISVALYKWPCDPVSEKISAYIDKEVNTGPSADPAVTCPSEADPTGVDSKMAGPSADPTITRPSGTYPSGVDSKMAGPSADPAITRPSNADPSGVDSKNAGPSADPAITRPSGADPSGVDSKNDVGSVGSTSCTTLIQSEADVTVNTGNLSSEVTEPKRKLSLGSDGDHQTVVECGSSLSETPTCSRTEISAPESETAVVTVLSDESSAEDQKGVVTSLESEFGSEALNEATSAPPRVDATESSKDAMDHDDSNILASQSSDKVNLSNSRNDDAGSIGVDLTGVSEECSKELHGEDEKADLLEK